MKLVGRHALRFLYLISATTTIKNSVKLFPLLSWWSLFPLMQHTPKKTPTTFSLLFFPFSFYSANTLVHNPQLFAALQNTTEPLYQDKGRWREFTRPNQHTAEVPVICTTRTVICIAALWYVWRGSSEESFTEVQMLIFLLLVLFWEYANNPWNDWHQRSLISISQFRRASLGSEMRQHPTFSLSTRTMQIKGGRSQYTAGSDEEGGRWTKYFNFNYSPQTYMHHKHTVYVKLALRPFINHLSA